MLALWLLLITTTAFSQPGYRFENYTVANGLSDNRITCFLKDRSGFIWIGTENGLNRFDGQRFLTYTQSGRQNISNGYVNAIAQDLHGKIWVATQRGLNVIDPGSDSITVFLSEDGNARKSNRIISSDLIWDICIDNRNRVWMAPDGKDLCYYDIEKKSFIYFPWKLFIEKKFPGRKAAYHSIRKIYYRSEHELWLGTSLGLYSYNILTNQFSCHSSSEGGHFLQLESSTDSSTVYFSQTTGQGLQVISPANHKTQTVNWNDMPPCRENRITPHHLKYMRWLPSGSGGLAEINTVTGEASLISHRLDDPYSLPAGLVRTVYTDASGVVWVGTTTGVGKFSPLLNPFTFTPVLAGSTQKKAEKDLYPIDHLVHTILYSKTHNKYYISSPATNRMLIMDGNTHEIKTITTIRGVPLKQCSVLFEDSKGLLWIMAHNRAFTYDRTTETFETARFQAASGNVFITDMAEDDEGSLWISCLNDGLYRYSPATGKQQRITSFPEQESVLPTSLYFDKKQRKLWIGTFGNGLFQYDFNRSLFRSFFAEKKLSGTLNTTLITDIVGDENAVWIATSTGGISKCSAANEQINGFTPVTAANGLPDNTIYSLQKDLNGNIWATGFKGLTEIDGRSAAIKSFTEKNGLAFTDFYSPLTVTAGGHLLTGINNGFLKFHPDSLLPVLPPYNVVITSFKADSFCYYRHTPLQKITLKPANSSEITFSFAALTYYYPKETRYEYKLEGVNKDWVSNGNTDNVKYNNLPPGKYCFKIRAYDFTGKQSANEAVLFFEILPPWWQTWWMRSIGMLAIAALLLTMYLGRVRSIRKKASLQYQMGSLKEQALRSQMNPHFIFNSLNAIQELIVTENYVASFQYLSKFSKLLRFVLHASEKNILPLSKEIEITRLYIELESLRFKNLFQYDISLSGDIDTDNTPFPTLLLQPFVENAIWHGLLPKEGLKTLSIVFTEKNNSLICTIKDNGIGREQAQKIKQNKIALYQSEPKGIEMAKHRLEILKLVKECSGSITINNVYEPGGTIAGTVVEIIITPNEKVRS